MTVREAVAELTETLNGFEAEGQVWVRVVAVRVLLEEVARFDECRRNRLALSADAGYCHAIDTLRKALAAAVAERGRHE